jgi:hypothetical protein
MEQIKMIKERMDERLAKEGGRGAVRAREAAAAEREAAEAAADAAERDATMREMREQAEGALAGTAGSDSFDVLEPASLRAIFAPATPGASAGEPPRAADAAAGGKAQSRLVASLCRRLMARGAAAGGQEDPMDADDGGDEEDREGVAALLLAGYPYCPGAAAADAAAAGAAVGASASAEAAGRGALRVLASPEAASQTAVVLGAGVALLARMGVRDPELAAGSDVPAVVAAAAATAAPSSSSRRWIPRADDFVAVFRALGYGAAFVEAAGALPSSSAASSTTSPPRPTPRGAASACVALRVLRHALELDPSAMLSSSAKEPATALLCGLLRLRLDPSVRAAALPALDAALAALLPAVPAKDWPAVCGAGAALIGAPAAPSHRAALVLLQELPTGRAPRAAQLQAAGALALLRTLAQCLHAGDAGALEGLGGGGGGGGKRGGNSKRGGAGTDGGSSAAAATTLWPTTKDVMDALGRARTFFAPVNATDGAAAATAGAAAMAAAAADDDEDDEGAAAAAAAGPPPGPSKTAAAYWAAITALDAADLVLWAHVDGSLARARAAAEEEEGQQEGGAGGAGAWTRGAGAAWAKWLGEAGKQVRRTIWLHALRARIGELEHTYELVAGGVAAGA